MLYGSPSDRISAMPRKPTDFNLAVGRRLKQLRKAEGHATIRAFARVLGVDEGRYRAWERGENGLPTPIADMLETRYGAAISWLYRGETRELRVSLFERIKSIAV